MARFNGQYLGPLELAGGMRCEGVSDESGEVGWGLIPALHVVAPCCGGSTTIPGPGTRWGASGNEVL